MQPPPKTNRTTTRAATGRHTELAKARLARAGPWRATIAYVVASILLLGGRPESQSRGLVAGRIDRLPVVLGEVWLIPGDGGTSVRYSTIQAAVDAASEGDTVRLSDGLFRGPGNRDVLVTGKNLRIESENGPARCVIDCERRGRGFSFTGSKVTQKTILRGVTILRGDPEFSIAGSVGGGILVDIDSLTTIEDCVIGYCSAGLGGGIAYNRVQPDPLGIIRDCVIFGNSGSDGGGIRAFDVLIDRCTIVDNVANDQGAGVYIAANGVVRDCVIARNEIQSPFINIGGGLLVRNSVRVESCTIFGNTAMRGGGIATGLCPSVVVASCILWGNRASVPGGGDAVWQDLSFGFSDILVRYCDIEGGTASVTSTPVGGGMPQLFAISDVDPRFADEAAGDYHLTSASPLIGAGDPELAVQAFEADHDGEPRVNGPLDMGADELYEGLALSYPLPGRVGEPNTVRARGAAPGAIVLLYAGFQPGLKSLAFAWCPDLALMIADGQLLAALTADGEGAAAFRSTPPAALAGETVLLQAVVFDPFAAAAICRTSNRVSFTFP